MRVEVIYPKGSIGSEEDAAKQINFRDEHTHILLDIAGEWTNLYALCEEVWERLNITGDDECREQHLLDLLGERSMMTGDLVVIHTEGRRIPYICVNDGFVVGEFVTKIIKLPDKEA
jgi:hypothetical protein